MYFGHFGIVGASAALYLRRMGLRVVLLERDLCGSRSSGVNFGGVRRQGRALALLPLAQRSHLLWGGLRETIGSDGEYLRSGHLKIARSPADMDSLEAYRERTRDFDLGLQLLGREALRERCPWLGDAAVGGSLCPDGRFGGCAHRTTLPRARRRRLGGQCLSRRVPAGGSPPRCHGAATCR